MKRFLRSVAPAAAVAAIAVAGATAAPAGSPTNAYVAKVLTSNQPGAPVKDPNLQNAWGVAFSPSGSPFWISDNNSGLSTLYDGNGTIIPLVVTIPCPTKAGEGSSCPKSAAPTGIIWNPTTSPTSAFLVPGTTLPASFIWDTEDGTISAWNGGLTNNKAAVIAVDNSVTPRAKDGAVYKGLAFGVNETGTFLFATNFRAGTIDVFAPNQSSTGTGMAYKQLTLSKGAFTDPNIPAGFAPFGIQNIDGSLIVTYAKQDASKHDDVAGDGNGYVDAYDTDGNLLQRLATQGGLNSPWGVARASYAFGAFAGDLLIGNFGNGWINALTPKGLVLLNAAGGGLLTIPGLWTLTLGGGAVSNPSTLYFTAGPNAETDGRFGTIAPAPSSSATPPWN